MCAAGHGLTATLAVFVLREPGGEHVADRCRRDRPLRGRIRGQPVSAGLMPGRQDPAFLPDLLDLARPSSAPPLPVSRSLLPFASVKKTSPSLRSVSHGSIPGRRTLCVGPHRTFLPNSTPVGPAARGFSSRPAPAPHPLGREAAARGSIGQPGSKAFVELTATSSRERLPASRKLKGG